MPLKALIALGAQRIGDFLPILLGLHNAHQVCPRSGAGWSSRIALGSRVGICSSSSLSSIVHMGASARVTSVTWTSSSSSPSACRAQGYQGPGTLVTEQSGKGSARPGSYSGRPPICTAHCCTRGIGSTGGRFSWSMSCIPACRAQGYQSPGTRVALKSGKGSAGPGSYSGRPCAAQPCWKKWVGGGGGGRFSWSGRPRDPAASFCSTPPASPHPLFFT
jgi:hypothetical protein